MDRKASSALSCLLHSTIEHRRAASAGDIQPLETYCATLRDDSEWPDIVRATVTAITALRRTFDPLRDQLQPLLEAYLADHRRQAQQRYADSIRKHGCA
jgi:hypothetical protein